MVAVVFVGLFVSFFTAPAHRKMAHILWALNKGLLKNYFFNICSICNCKPYFDCICAGSVDMFIKISHTNFGNNKREL